MHIDNTLKSKANQLFWIFETYYFKNTGNYPRKTNLVLEFSEFINFISQDDLEKIIPISSKQEFLQLKSMINNGIDIWLDAGDIKTMLLS